MNDLVARASEALGLGSDPAAIASAVRRLYAEIDTEVASAASRFDLPCKRGCDACCRESVFMSAPEFLTVLDALAATRTPAEIEAVFALMCGLAERFADELELLDELPPGPERTEVASRIKFDCPMLDGAGACTVYTSRELNSRTFGQAWDGVAGEVYGCKLTRESLRVIPDERCRSLFDAREARRRLVAVAPGTEKVQPFPYWFAAVRRAVAVGQLQPEVAPQLVQT